MAKSKHALIWLAGAAAWALAAGAVVAQAPETTPASPFAGTTTVRALALGADPIEPAVDRAEAESLSIAARAALESGDLQTAAEAMGRIAAYLEAAPDADPMERAGVTADYAGLLGDLGAGPLAVEAYRLAAERFEAAAGAGADPTLNTREKQIRVLLTQERHAEALDLVAETIGKAEAAEGTDPRWLATLQGLRAFVYHRAGDSEAAVEAARAAEPVIIAAFGPDAPETLNAKLDLGVYLRDLGRDEEAAVAFAAAEALGPKVAEPGRRIADAAFEAAHALNRLGRFEDSLAAFDRSLVEAERVGLSDADRWLVRNDRSGVLWSLSRFEEAEAGKRAVIDAFTAIEGTTGAQVVNAELDLMGLLGAQGRVDEAVALGEAVRARVEAETGESVDTAYVIFKIAMAHRGRSDCVNARPLFERAAAILRTLPGGSAEDVANNLTSAAECASQTSDYADAVALATDALEFVTGASGPTGPVAIRTLIALGFAQGTLGRYDDALASYDQAKALLDAGEANPDLEATFAVNASQLKIRLGDFIGAQTLLEEGRKTLIESDFGRSLSMMGLLNVQADVAETFGDYAAAEKLLREAVDIAREVGSEKDTRPAIAIGNLASLLSRTKQYEEAGRLFDESRERLTAAIGPDNLEMSGLHHNVGLNLLEQGRFDEAEVELQRSRDLMERRIGREHRDFAATLNALARLYVETGELDKAAAALDEAQAIVEATVGADNFDAANNLVDIADVARKRKDFPASIAAASRAFDITRARFGDEHVNLNASAVAAFRARAGASPDQRGVVDPALLAALDAALSRGWTGLGDRAIDKAAMTRVGAPEAAALDALVLFERALKSGDLDGADAARLEPAFQIAQAFGGSSASDALAAAAARLSIGDAEKQDLLRRRESETARLSLFERQLAAMRDRPVAERVAAEETLLEAEVSAVRKALADIADRLQADDADFAEIAAGRGLTVKEVQALLRPEEALVVFSAPDPDGQVLAIAIRPDRAVAASPDLTVKDLAETVKYLREGLTPPASGRVADLPAFDLKTAQGLRQTLFDPLSPALEGAERLLVVAEGPLASLPLHVLVTEPGEGDALLKRYRATRWLSDDYAMAILPAVSSLKALRDGARPSQADRPLLGFGDPVMPRAAAAEPAVEPAEPMPTEVDEALPEDPFATLKQLGGASDAAALSALPALEETADLLRSVADRLGARETDLFLGADAQEEELRILQERGRLKRYRVIAFATHALVAGELKGLGLIEPALVLSAPGGDASDPANDGLLRASEAVEFDLDADLVVLAACNTAAADGSPGAEALSGLARAFFYSGARALLVSHWPAEATATATLVPAMTDAMTEGAPRAEALAQAIKLVRDDPDRPYFAHPALWAPFVVVGEGG